MLTAFDRLDRIKTAPSSILIANDRVEHFLFVSIDIVLYIILYCFLSNQFQFRKYWTSDMHRQCFENILYVQKRIENSALNSQIHSVDCKNSTADFVNRTVDYKNHTADLRFLCSVFYIVAQECLFYAHSIYIFSCYFKWQHSTDSSVVSLD